MLSTNPDHFFESDSIKEARRHQKARISYARGTPFRLPGKILCIAAYQQGSTIAVGSSNGVGYIFNTHDLSLSGCKNRLSLTTTCSAHKGPISAISFYHGPVSPGALPSLMVITGSWDHSIRIFDGWNGALLFSFADFLPDIIKSIHLCSPLLFCGDARGSLCSFDLQTRAKKVSKITQRSIEKICAIPFGDSEDGHGIEEEKSLFIAVSDGSLLMTKQHDLSQVDLRFGGEGAGHATSIYALAVSGPDTILTGSADGYIYGWDIQDDSFYSIAEKGHFDVVTDGITVFQNGTETLYTTSLDCTIRTWIIPAHGVELQETPTTDREWVHSDYIFSDNADTDAELFAD